MAHLPLELNIHLIPPVSLFQIIVLLVLFVIRRHIRLVRILYGNADINLPSEDNVLNIYELLK